MLTRTLMLTVALLWALPGRASITIESDIKYWPRSEIIGRRPFIILGFSFESTFVKQKQKEIRAVFRGLSSKHAPFLASHNEIVKLTIREIIKFPGYRQVVLAPEHDLTPGKQYELVFRGFARLHHLLLGDYNSSWGWQRRPVWKVADRLHSLDSLVWRQKPTSPRKAELTGFLAHLTSSDSTHPKIYVQFGYELIIPLDEVAIRVSLRQLRSGKRLVYYRTRPHRRLFIGRPHSADFMGFLDDDAPYEVTFDLLDVHGNELKWEGPPLTFTTSE